MEELFDLALFFPIIGVLEVLCIVFSILFMHFSAQYRNQKLSLGWYICGVLFGFWTLIIFLIKRKDFPGPNTKVCYQCGDKYPDSFQMCSRCLIDLPVINREEKAKQKKLSKIMGIALIITCIAAVIVGGIIGFTTVQSILGDDGLMDDVLGVEYKIAVDGAYYDKKGNRYESWKEVILYDEEGRTYKYVEEPVQENEDNILSIYEYYYVRADGETYFSYDCYVTAEGYFYCDKAGSLELYTDDTDNMSEEELDEYYNNLLESADDEYRYYDYPYTDKDGNLYYCADEASWNEKGELITAENYIEKE
ncbi:MAG: hypothetical protein IJ491_04130 [Clostridia bacterium]|nr:hypothetical protein [Clostridia bacterium]